MMLHRPTMLALLPALLLAACGRDVPNADVKMVGVGDDPDEIGAPPTPYGGVVEYDHVDFGGAGLPLALMGLGGTDAVGPQLAQFEPPYQGVFGFSYVFDQKLPAAATLVQVGAPPPEAEDTCYTSFDPQGPIGSFTTVDVGDRMRFESTESDAGFTLGRFPSDYPPDPQDLFIYYVGFQYHTPEPRTHRVPSADAPADPLSMEQATYRRPNYPFGEEVALSFPGGFASFDHPVSSIPRPSGDLALQMPEELGPVLLEWTGPRYDHTGEVLDEGAQKRCFEFYEGRPLDPELSVEDCAGLVDTPGDADTYDAFRGQVYTAPWDTDDGQVTLRWQPTEADDTVYISVRFMAPFDKSDPDNAYQAVEMPTGDYRPAQPCESGEPVYDEAAYETDGELKSSLQGDPFSQMINVTCRLADDGEHVLDDEIFERALQHAESEPVGGVVFFLSRATSAEVAIPPAKDRWNQRHEISPMKVLTQSVRIGRFQWEQ